MLRRLRICLAALTLAAVPVLAWAPGSADASWYAPPWSGYIALNPPEAPYAIGIHGLYNMGWGADATWWQPAGDCTSTKTAAASFWVGLGNYSDASGPVEQAGTDTDCSGGSPVYYAWYATSFASQVTFGGAISPGDLMAADVVCYSGNCTLSVEDRTAGWTASVTTPLSGTPSSSEVVVSRAKSGTVPLTNFGIADFNGMAFGGWFAPISTFSPSQIPAITNDAGTPLDSTTDLVTDTGTLNTHFRATWLAAS
jgi:hypothetical protein